MCKSVLGGASKPAPVVLPAVQEPPAQVQEGDAAVSTARENERKRRIAASGGNNTLVTGGQGLVAQPSTGGGQLFGA